MPSKKPATKGGKKTAVKSATKPAAKAKAPKKAPAKAAKKPEAAAAPKARAAKASARTASNGGDAKPAAAVAVAKPPVAVAPAAVAVVKKDGAAPAKKGKESQRTKTVIPWAQRFKDDAPGPWTCPKCGALPQRAQPLYGEDERHHCPNIECDQVVTLLSKEDLEPAEKRGSWPPQRNKNRAIPGQGPPGGLPPPPMAEPPAD